MVSKLSQRTINSSAIPKMIAILRIGVLFINDTFGFVYAYFTLRGETSTYEREVRGPRVLLQKTDKGENLRPAFARSSIRILCLVDLGQQRRHRRVELRVA